jgi:hypothetical protein
MSPDNRMLRIVGLFLFVSLIMPMAGSAAADMAIITEGLGF